MGLAGHYADKVDEIDPSGLAGDKLREGLTRMEKMARRGRKKNKKNKKNKKMKHPIFLQSDMARVLNAEAATTLTMLLESEALQGGAAESVGEGLQDLYGRTPLHYASKFNNPLACTILLEAM
jgi:hypothetical protein